MTRVMYRRVAGVRLDGRVRQTAYSQLRRLALSPEGEV
jgi:hypothetical protein